MTHTEAVDAVQTAIDELVAGIETDLGRDLTDAETDDVIDQYLAGLEDDE